MKSANGDRGESTLSRTYYVRQIFTHQFVGLHTAQVHHCGSPRMRLNKTSSSTTRLQASKPRLAVLKAVRTTKVGS